MIYIGYFSFGVEKTNTFIRYRGSLVNHTVKIYSHFPDQNGSKTIPFGEAHTYIAYIGEYPTPRVPGITLVAVPPPLPKSPKGVVSGGPGDRT